MELDAFNQLLGILSPHICSHVVRVEALQSNLLLCQSFIEAPRAHTPLEERGYGQPDLTLAVLLVHESLHNLGLVQNGRLRAVLQQPPS